MPEDKGKPGGGGAPPSCRTPGTGPFREPVAPPAAESAGQAESWAARNPPPNRNFRKIACFAGPSENALLGQLAHVEDTNHRWRYRQGRFWAIVAKWARYDFRISRRTRAISVETCMNPVESRWRNRPFSHEFDRSVVCLKVYEKRDLGLGTRDWGRRFAGQSAIRNPQSAMPKGGDLTPGTRNQGRRFVGQSAIPARPAGGPGRRGDRNLARRGGPQSAMPKGGDRGEREYGVRNACPPRRAQCGMPSGNGGRRPPAP